MKALDTEALRRACREVAGSTLWQTSEPWAIDDIIDSEQIENAVAAYYKQAEEHSARLADGGHDPNFVTRAVLYLAHEHAIPPMKDDIRWFAEALEVLVRLVDPISYPRAEDALFMADLERAARRNRREAQGPPE